MINAIAEYLRRVIEHRWPEAALRESEEKYRILVEHIPQRIFVKDRNSTYVSCNDNYARDLGIRAEEIAGKTDFDFFPEELAWEYVANDRSVMESGQTEEMEDRYIHNGVERWVETLKTPVKDETGNRVGILGIFWDITDRKCAEEALSESEERYRTLFEQSRDAVYITARDGRFIDANRSFLDLFGYAGEEVLGLNARQLYADHTARPRFREAVEAKGGVVDYEVKLRKKDGTEMDCLITATVRAGRDGSLLGYQGIIRDISEQKRAQETIKRLAHHDALTGLANRTLFNDRLSVALAHAHRNQHELAVMLLDLDQFKQINDALGHPAGDRLLKAVGERLTTRLRGEDTVCRMGGDEFLLLLPEMASAKDAGRVAEGILKVIRQPIALNGREVRSTASLGLALYPYDGEDADALVKNADIAMYRAKEKGRDNYQRYSNGGPEAVPALEANV